MMRYVIPLAMLFVFAGTTSGTMWLYDDPTFFQIGNQIASPSFQPVGLSPLEIVEAPFFPLLGESFYKSALPVQMRNTTQAMELSSSRKPDTTPVQITFSGALENNLRYAQSKSSLRIGQAGSWTSINPPGLLK